MPRLTSNTLPDELSDNPFADLEDDEIEVSHVNGISIEDEEDQDADAGAGKPPRKAQNDADNEDGEGDGDEDGDEDLDNPAVVAAVARERAHLREREDAWLKEQEAADQALLNAEKAKLKSQKDAFAVALDALDIRIKTAQEALKLARQDNDHNASTDIEAEISNLRHLKSQTETNASKLPEESRLDDAFKKHIETRRTKVKDDRGRDGSDDGIKPLNSKAQKWSKANAAWFGKDQTAMGALQRIDSALAIEGYDPKSDEYFSELTKRMARAAPKAGVRGIGQQQRRSASDLKAQNKRAPVAGARGAQPIIGARSPGSKVRVNLDSSDRAMMKKLGIDPSDKKAVAYYAKSRAEGLARDQQKGS